MAYYYHFMDKRFSGIEPETDVARTLDLDCWTVRVWFEYVSLGKNV